MNHIDEFLKNYQNDRQNFLEKEVEAFRAALASTPTTTHAEFLIWLSKWFHAKPRKVASGVEFVGRVLEIFDFVYEVSIQLHHQLTIGEKDVRSVFQITAYPESKLPPAEKNHIVNIFVALDRSDVLDAPAGWLTEGKCFDHEIVEAQGYEIYWFGNIRPDQDIEELTGEIHDRIVEKCESNLLSLRMIQED